MMTEMVPALVLAWATAESAWDIEAGIPPMRSLGDGRRLLLWASIFRRLLR
jgi:hypothetical protein